MLNVDSSRRATPDQLLNHEYFSVAESWDRDPERDSTWSKSDTPKQVNTASFHSRSSFGLASSLSGLDGSRHKAGKSRRFRIFQRSVAVLLAATLQDGDMRELVESVKELGAGGGAEGE